MQKIFLLADDDSDDQAFFCEALQEIDPSIVCYCVADGRATLELLSNEELERPHIIFLDINMPGMNGWECLTKLKQHEEHTAIPVIIYSTSSHPKDADLALDLGAMCFFTKPNDYQELKEILKVLIGCEKESILDSVSHFNGIRTRKIITCADEKQV
jgi:CheY-like chemotaxis protein